MHTAIIPQRVNGGIPMAKSNAAACKPKINDKGRVVNNDITLGGRVEEERSRDWVTAIDRKSVV